MEKTTWKIIAIIFIALFILETGYAITSIWYVVNQEQKTNECYYDVCKEYPQAEYTGGVCTCYDYDMIGDYVAVDWKVM